jgi:porphobilinogen synthase
VSFPTTRPRRLRQSDALRRLVRETRLSPEQLVAPLFVCDGEGVRQEIAAMPGCSRMSVDVLVDECRELAGLGIPAVMLFGIPSVKDPEGAAAADPQGPVARALAAVRQEVPALSLWADVCLCEYTDHGHCGPLATSPRGVVDVDNDRALPRLVNAACAYARAGADVVAPSDMMDGRIGAIRAGLDAEGRTDVVIVSYAAKYASAFYGPFREAAGSTPAFGDRRTYQMDPANGREALKEVAADLDEGADVVMVKPALAYLDVVWRVKERFDVPVAAYNVSGEYAMVRAAGQLGWIDGSRAAMESLTCIRRAGADIILTYFAKEAARQLG